MKHIVIAGSAIALLLFGALWSSSAKVSAQPPVCMSLAPGEHSITAPARDRDGEVTFTLRVAPGGVVTEFIEPGGQSIPPASILTIFAGADSYPLPEGVAIIECDAGSASNTSASSDVCLNLEAGTHEASVTAGGRAYDLILRVGEGGVVQSVELLGQTYSAQEAMGLLAEFGATLPAGLRVVPCATGESGPIPELYPTSGTGGLAEESRGGAWLVMATAATAGSLLLAALGLTQRRRLVPQLRD